jgi:hypothetical protein
MAQHTANPFVTACAQGDLGEVLRRLKAGEDINQIDAPPPRIGPEPDYRDPAVLDAIQKELERRADEISTTLTLRALDPVPPTLNKSGLGAAMAAHQLTVVRVLMRRGADPAIGNRHPLHKNITTSAIELGIQHGFVAGVAFLTEECGLGRPADALLFSSLPRVQSIHSFNANSPPEYLERARTLDDTRIKNGLAMFDYLIDKHGLSIETRTAQGQTIVAAACAGCDDGFYGDNGRVLRHVLARGGNPNAESTIDKSARPKFIIAKNALREATGKEHEEISAEDNDTSLSEYFGLINKGRHDQTARFETTPLINSCYQRNFRAAHILLDDPRTSPLHVDRHGNNAFVALEEGRRDHILAKEHEAEYKDLLKKMTTRAQEIYGASYRPFVPRPR